MPYRDRHADFRLIRYYIRHCDAKKLQKLLNLVGEELAKKELSK